MVLIWSIVDYRPTSFGSYVFPPWAQGIGWTLLCIALAIIPAYGVWTFRKKSTPLSPCGANFRAAFKPSDSWAPYERKNRTGKYVGRVLKHDIAAIASHRASSAPSPSVPQLNSSTNSTVFQKSNSFRPASQNRYKRANRNDFFDDRPCASQMI